MDFHESPEAQAFRAEVRAFLREHWSHERALAIENDPDHATHDWALHRAFAERGWIRAAMPTRLGGQGRGPEELAALFQEFELAGAPYDGMSVAMTISSVIAQVGNDFHKQAVIPKVLAGESLLAMGYSEPGSGSDVAAAQTRAVRDRDGWLINGQKMWTSLAEESEWVLLLTRTNTEVPKHKGLTFFLVPTDTPGITVQGIRTLSGKRTNATYYDNVRLDDRWRLGEVDGGWTVMTVALAYERGVMGGVSDGLRLLAVAEHEARRTGRIAEASVRERLVRTAIDNEVASLLGSRAAWVTASGALPGLEGSEVKMFATEAFTKASSWFVDLLGPQGVLQHGAARVASDGFLEHAWRYATVTTIFGGTAEIQRNNIAERMLGLPRAR
jgi:alkylation response protein AidB-like acyl-CoA dehydrogenase